MNLFQICYLGHINGHFNWNLELKKMVSIKFPFEIKCTFGPKIGHFPTFLVHKSSECSTKCFFCLPFSLHILDMVFRGQPILV